MSEAETKRERRIAITRATPELLIQMMRTGYRTRGSIECVEGVPETAVCVSTTHDPVTNAVLFFWQDESFAPVPLGEKAPVLQVVLREIAPEDDHPQLNAVVPPQP